MELKHADADLGHFHVNQENQERWKRLSDASPADVSRFNMQNTRVYDIFVLFTLFSVRTPLFALFNATNPTFIKPLGDQFRSEHSNELLHGGAAGMNAISLNGLCAHCGRRAHLFHPPTVDYISGKTVITSSPTTASLVNCIDSKVRDQTRGEISRRTSGQVHSEGCNADQMLLEKKAQVIREKARGRKQEQTRGDGRGGGGN